MKDKDKKKKRAKEKKEKKVFKLFKNATKMNESMQESIQQTLSQVDSQSSLIAQSADEHNQHLDRIGQKTEKLGVEVDTIAGKMDDLVKKYSRHDLALGDVVDSMEEFGKDHQDRLTQIEKMTIQLENMLEREERRQTEALIRLCMAYQDQLDALQRFASKDPAWSEQLKLIQDVLEPYLYKSTFQPVGYSGEAIQYDWHEILDVLETDNPNLDMRVADVYERGYLYGGNVYRKAKVSAWRLIELKTEENKEAAEWQPTDLQPEETEASADWRPADSQPEETEASAEWQPTDPQPEETEEAAEWQPLDLQTEERGVKDERLDSWY